MSEVPPLALALRQHADAIYDTTKPVVDLIESIDVHHTDQALVRAKENAICSLNEAPAAIHMLAHALTAADQ